MINRSAASSSHLRINRHARICNHIIQFLICVILQHRVTQLTSVLCTHPQCYIPGFVAKLYVMLYISLDLTSIVGRYEVINFKGCHFPKDVIMMGIRWYVSYPLSYRHVEKLMEERGIELDHATVNRWVVKYSPALEANFRKYKRPVGKSWRMDETYIKVKGEWVYYYRAVDKEGQTIDFFLSRKRDTEAAQALELLHNLTHIQSYRFQQLN
jgi:putative transposase